MNGNFFLAVVDVFSTSEKKNGSNDPNNKLRSLS